MSNLKNIRFIENKRAEIDKLNRSLVRLFLQRQKLAKKIIQAKKKNGLHKFDAKRTEDMYRKALRGLRPKEKMLVRAFLKNIFTASLK